MFKSLAIVPVLVLFVCSLGHADHRFRAGASWRTVHHDIGKATIFTITSVSHDGNFRVRREMRTRDIHGVWLVDCCEPRAVEFLVTVRPPAHAPSPSRDDDKIRFELMDGDSRPNPELRYICFYHPGCGDSNADDRIVVGKADAKKKVEELIEQLQAQGKKKLSIAEVAELMREVAHECDPADDDVLESGSPDPSI